MTTVRIRREPGIQLEGEGGDAESLQLLDTACLCSICHSFFDAPLILRGCGHSFCSACIRQSLDFQEKSGGPNCPTCRTPCDARDLVPNVALREVVHHYTACKQRLNAEFLDCENNKNKHRQTSGPTTRSRSRGKEDRTLDDDDEHGREKSKERRVHAGSSPSSLCLWDDEKDEEWGVEEDEEDPDELLSPVVKKPRRQKQTCREETSSHVSILV